jgi:hypothetical protein
VRIIAACILALTLGVCASPVSAKGKHISCQFKASLRDGDGGEERIKRTLNFYLDDTHSQLMSEGGELPEGMILVVRTTSYSDTEIRADINVGPVSGGPFFFGHVTDGEVAFVINRVSGIAGYGTKFLPNGAEVGLGPCSEVAPPRAKF